MGICQYVADEQPLVETKARPNQADLMVTLVYEYAHALLHSSVDAEREWAKREVEAVEYIVRRLFELDTSGSAFYLAAWQSEDPASIQDRFKRISSTAEKLIDVINR